MQVGGDIVIDKPKPGSAAGGGPPKIGQDIQGLQIKSPKSATGSLGGEDLAVGKPAPDSGSPVAWEIEQRTKALEGSASKPSRGTGFVPRQAGATSEPGPQGAAPAALPPPGGRVKLGVSGKSEPVAPGLKLPGANRTAEVAGASRPHIGEGEASPAPSPWGDRTGHLLKVEAAVSGSAARRLGPGGSILAGALPVAPEKEAPEAGRTAGTSEAPEGLSDEDYFAALRPPVTPPEPRLRGRVDNTRHIAPEGLSPGIGGEPARLKERATVTSPWRRALATVRGATATSVSGAADLLSFTRKIRSPRALADWKKLTDEQKAEVLRRVMGAERR